LLPRVCHWSLKARLRNFLKRDAGAEFLVSAARHAARLTGFHPLAFTENSALSVVLFTV
jgi:hypothetical protein